MEEEAKEDAGHPQHSGWLTTSIFKQKSGIQFPLQLHQGSSFLQGVLHSKPILPCVLPFKVESFTTFATYIPPVGRLRTSTLLDQMGSICHCHLHSFHHDILLVTA